MKTLGTIFLLLSTAFLLNAQNVSKSSVNYKTFHLPTIPINDINTIGFKIYSVYDGLNLGSLKVKKLDQAQEQMNEKKRFFLNEIEVTDGDGDLTIEVAYGKVSLGEKKMEERKAPCVRDDGNLSKDDIQTCPAYYYTFDYTLPAAFVIKDKTGKVVYGEVFESEHSTSWGISDLKPFLKKAELTKAYENGGEKSVIHNIHTQKIKDFFDAVDDFLYFEKYTHKFEFGSGKGKKHDYTELEATMEKAVEIFKAEEPDFSKLNECIVVWEKELETADIGDKEARINKKIARELHNNLANAYMYQHQYVNALKHAREFKRIASNTTRADNLMNNINRKFISYKIHGDIKLPEKLVKAKDFKVLVDAQRKDANFFHVEDKSAEAIASAIEFREQFKAEIKEEKKELAKESSAGENPYRKQVVTNPTQGTYLWFDSYSNRDLVGKTLPEEITQLKEINWLRAYNMKFTEIPESISDLTNLTKLDLTGCNLKSLPASIGTMKELKTLILANNPIEKLPSELTQITGLKTLNLKGTSVSAEQVAEIQKALPKLKIKM